MAHLDLKVGAPTVSVELAKEYMERYKDEFHKKSAITNLVNEPNILLCKKKLVEKIEENTELFCQLEHLLRKKPMDEVKNIDLKIIKNSLLDNFSWASCTDSVTFTDTTPLALLAIFSYNYVNDKEFRVVGTEQTTPLCYLFVKLCRDVGLNNVTFGLTDKKIDKCMFFNKFTCAGVVTEKSDINSAVDAFLLSSSQHPWSLKRIFVQENVYETFKKCIEGKSKLKEQENAKVTEDVKKLANELYVYKNKVFMFDFAGDYDSLVDSTVHNICVEAYRTTKEVLSLIQNVNFLSLWSSDIAEAHEIAVAAPSTLIWVNDIDNMDGPPFICRWLPTLHYNLFYKETNYKLILSKKSIVTSFTTWGSKYDTKRRSKIIWEAFNNFKSEDITSSANELVKLVEKEILHVQSHNSLEIDNGTMYMSVGLPVGVLPLAVTKLEDVLIMIRSLLLGNGCVIYKGDTDVTKILPRFRSFLETLIKAGVPVLDSTKDEASSVKENYVTYKTIVSNFGTIFAN
ncbi:uncharacterized protein LOC131851180 [Achroia grisella]|uniref:uncharacterized protein LOC131851180 n=1 Tax=Achroia grisella TaxID=688607 RepID=UPI0027D34C23|nr:uncharacterized protein LOC131851180 [Achroia grisella]